MVKRIVHAVKKFFGSKEDCSDECCKPSKHGSECCECEPMPKKKTAKKSKKRK